MHPSSLQIMTGLIQKYKINNCTVLDVGSQDVNGTYKNLFSPKVIYTGVDIAAGKNVDIVSPDLYHWPIESDKYDVVISGQCLEHVEDSQVWIREVYRVTKPGGLTIIIAPWNCGEHRYPVDCWRILPDGMRFLLNKVAAFSIIEVGRNDTIDTWGVGRK
jgi:SAM-dependent methyltransferase